MGICIKMTTYRRGGLSDSSTTAYESHKLPQSYIQTRRIYYVKSPSFSGYGAGEEVQLPPHSHSNRVRRQLMFCVHRQDVQHDPEGVVQFAQTMRGPQWIQRWVLTPQRSLTRSNVHKFVGRMAFIRTREQIEELIDARVIKVGVTLKLSLDVAEARQTMNRTALRKMCLAQWKAAWKIMHTLSGTWSVFHRSEAGPTQRLRRPTM